MLFIYISPLDLFLHRQMQRPHGRNGQIENPDSLYHGNVQHATSVRQDEQLLNHGRWSSKTLSDATVRSHGHPLNMPPPPSLSSMLCHKTYEQKQAWNKINSAKEFRAMRQKETLTYNQLGLPRQAKEHGGKTGYHRNVTFDLTESAMHTIDKHDVRYCGKSLKYCHMLNLDQVSGKSLKANIFERYLSSQTCKIQSRKSLKVKLNLNPLRRGKVHPNSSLRHNKDNPKNMKKMHKHKLKAKKVTRDKEQHSPNKSMQGQKSKNSKINQKSSSKKSSQLNLDTDTEGTVCILDNKNQEDHVQQPEPAMCPKTEEASEAETPANSQSNPSSSNQLPLSQPHAASGTLDEDVHFTSDNIINPVISKAAAVVQEYLYSPENSPKRKIRLIMPEKTTNRPATALDKKIR